MSLAIKVSNLRAQVKELKTANVPASAMKLVLTGLEAELKEIQSELNDLEKSVPMKPAPAVTQPPMVQKRETTPGIPKERGGYGQNKG